MTVDVSWQEALMNVPLLLEAAHLVSPQPAKYRWKAATSSNALFEMLRQNPSCQLVMLSSSLNSGLLTPDEKLTSPEACEGVDC